MNKKQIAALKRAAIMARDANEGETTPWFSREWLEYNDYLPVDSQFISLATPDSVLWLIEQVKKRRSPSKPKGTPRLD